MPATVRGEWVRATVAVVCLLVGLVSLGLWRVLGSAEELPYSPDAMPASTARVTEGNTYSLAVPGGVRTLSSRGTPATSGNVLDPSCTWSLGNSGEQTLTVSPESVGTKAVNTFAHFTAPVTGRLHIRCTNWGTVFVPDSDDRATDASLWYLVFSVLLLSVGAPLSLAAIRSGVNARKRRAHSYPEEAAEPDEQASTTG